MYAVPRLAADAFAELASTKTGDEADNLYNLARDKYRCVLELKPDDFSVLLNMGIVLTNLAKSKQDPAEVMSFCFECFSVMCFV